MDVTVRAENLVEHVPTRFIATWMRYQSRQEDALLRAYHQGVTATQLAGRQLPGRLVRLAVAPGQLEHLVIAYKQKLCRIPLRQQFDRDLAQAVEGDWVALLADRWTQPQNLRVTHEIVRKVISYDQAGLDPAAEVVPQPQRQVFTGPHQRTVGCRQVFTRPAPVLHVVPLGSLVQQPASLGGRR